MLSFPRCTWLLLLSAAICGTASGSVEETAPVRNFALTDAHGVDHALYDGEAAATVLAFTSVECPIAKLYAPRLARLEKEYRELGVRFLGVDPNMQDSPEEVRAKCAEVGLEFPILLDPVQALTDQLEVTRTTEVLLLDGDRRVVYRGALDDQYGIGSARPFARNNYLVDALEALLADEEVAVARTDAPGCLIARALDSDETRLTYHEDVAPILYKQCVDCHREGQIGPMSFMDYEDVQGWAPMIAEVVGNGRMPPWHADPHYGEFANRRMLTATESRILQEWARRGAPEGDPARHPTPPVYEDGGWAMGTPDLVVELNEDQKIPAEGVVPYRYALVDPGLTEDHWVQAMEVRPTNTAATHHVLVILIPPGKTMQEVVGGLGDGQFVESGYFAVNVPGSRPNLYPEGTAKLLPAGSQLLFQLHYTPNGVAGTDRTRIGFRWATGEIEHEVVTRGVFNLRLDIPPGEPEATFYARHTFAEPVRLISLFPHMHTRGSAFRFEVIREEDEIILDVPHYDFNWQNFYLFREPYRIDAGETLYLTAVYDNSADNPFNPDPQKRVRWGDQTFDEMFIGYIDYIVESDDDHSAPE